MVSDDELFKGMDAKAGAVGNMVALQHSTSPQDPSGRIIIRKMMSLTVFKVYPDGNMFIDQAQSKSWFLDSKEFYKPKQKKKAEPIKQAVLSSKEEY